MEHSKNALQNIMTDQTPHRCLDGAKNPALNLQFVSFGRGNIGSQKRENEMLGDKSILPNCVDKRTKQLVQCIVFFRKVLNTKAAQRTQSSGVQGGHVRRGEDYYISS